MMFFFEKTLLLIYFIAINFTTFIIFGLDKRAARRNEWRISEKTLFTVTALGGSIGAAVGMRCFHHKTQKLKFLIFVPICILVHGILIYQIISPYA